MGLRMEEKRRQAATLQSAGPQERARIW